MTLIHLIVWWSEDGILDLISSWYIKNITQISSNLDVLDQFPFADDPNTYSNSSRMILKKNTFFSLHEGHSNFMGWFGRSLCRTFPIPSWNNHQDQQHPDQQDVFQQNLIEFHPPKKKSLGKGDSRTVRFCTPKGITPAFSTWAVKRNLVGLYYIGDDIYYFPRPILGILISH